MKNLTPRDKKAEELSGEIILLARNTLLVNFRFMDRAIGNIRTVPDMNYRFAGNGAHVVYSPWSLIKMYQEEENVVARDLLHCIFHNVFRHSFAGEGIDRLKWDLAADIAVENCISELQRDFLRVERENRQSETITYLKEKIGDLTAERIYAFLNGPDVSYVQCYRWSEDFKGDDHDLWYGTKAGEFSINTDIDIEKLWEDISKRMQTEIELFEQEGGALTQNLRAINRTRYDYREFLKRFGLHSETIRLSEEEFDNNYYTYGINLFGNIPLIEPLEYTDKNRIKDLVIAIDTSGSVEGEIVQKFVQHTHDIIASQNSFDSETNLYILQCDDRIQGEAHITSREDFERYLAGMEIKGLGRTDFRPVFSHVDKLIEEGKINKLRGVLYFTDGKGIFPEKAPLYDSAFIIHNDSFNEVWTPEWAMKMEMETEEIQNL